jgi:hypothetical protein
MEMVCVVPGIDALNSRIASSRYIAVAKVEEDVPNSDARGSTYTLTVVRSYRGKVRKLFAARSYCEDCGSLKVGNYVLAFASGEHFEFYNICDAPQPVYIEQTKQEIIILDRRLKLPPLELPEEALKPGSPVPQKRR